MKEGFYNPLLSLLIKYSPPLLCNVMSYNYLLKINKGIHCLLDLLTNPANFTDIQNAW